MKKIIALLVAAVVAIAVTMAQDAAPQPQASATEIGAPVCTNILFGFPVKEKVAIDRGAQEPLFQTRPNWGLTIWGLIIPLIGICYFFPYVDGRGMARLHLLVMGGVLAGAFAGVFLGNCSLNWVSLVLTLVIACFCYIGLFPVLGVLEKGVFVWLLVSLPFISIVAFSFVLTVGGAIDGVVEYALCLTAPFVLFILALEARIRSILRGG